MKRFMFLIAVFALISSASAILVTDMNIGKISPEALVSTFIGEHVTVDVSSISLVSTSNSAGIYEDAFVESQGDPLMKNGILLSSGNVNHLNNNANSSDGISGYLLLFGGDPDLAQLVNNKDPLYDATVLEFDFTSDITGTASFTYVFGSDEYNEYVDKYDDVFGFFLGGVNYATIPGTNIPVSINTVNKDDNSQYFNNNDLNDFPWGRFKTEMDGFTVPLSVTFDVEAGEKYHLKLGVSDANDFMLDSWVLLGEGSFSVAPVSIPEPSMLILCVTALLSLLVFVKQKKTC